MQQGIVGAKIFDGCQFWQDHAVVVSEELISCILPANEVPDDIAQIVLSGGVLAPGFIDLQVNGGGGVLFNNNPSVETLKAMLSGHQKHGTTSMTPTFISDAIEICELAFSAVESAMASGVKGVLGIHLEGPFFDESRRGTHAVEHIRNPTMDDLSWLVSHHKKVSPGVTLVTLAPEHAPTEFIAALTDAGCIVCAGHTDADHHQIKSALDAGLAGFTHLYNAMRPMQGRDPGTVGAALADRDSWCGIIADGHHVHPLSLRVAIEAKPRGKVILVSDAMATVGSHDTQFSLYGEEICEADGRLVNADGRLAGSAIGLIEAVQYCVECVGVSLCEALRMASLYPASCIGQDHILGRIKSGYRADLVHFSEQYEVERTWVAGSLVVHQ